MQRPGACAARPTRWSPARRPASWPGSGSRPSASRSPRWTRSPGCWPARSCVGRPGGSVAGRARERCPSGQGRPRGDGRLVAGATAAVVAVAGWTGVAADRDLRAAERAAADRAPAAAVAAADRATARRPDDIDAWYVAARVASAPAGLPAVDAGLDRVEEGLTWSPRRPGPAGPAHRPAGRAGAAVGPARRPGRRPNGPPATGRSRDPSGPRAHRQLGLVLATAGQAGGGAGRAGPGAGARPRRRGGRAGAGGHRRRGAGEAPRKGPVTNDGDWTTGRTPTGPTACMGRCTRTS